MEQLPRMVAAVTVGKEVKVGLVREGKRMEVEVTVGEVAEEKARGREQTPEVEKTSVWWSRTSRPKSHTIST